MTAWNGFAITALAEASVALGRPEFLDAATRCARSIVDLHVVDGRLRRASLGGRVGDSAAILEDHAALATGAADAVPGRPATPTGSRAATGLLDVALDHFADPDRDGRWFDTADDAETADGAAVGSDRRRDAVGGVADHRGAAARRAPGRAARAERYAAAAAASLAAATPILVEAATLGRSLAGRRRGRRPRTPADRGGVRPRDSELLAAARLLAPGGAIVVGGAVDSSELLRGPRPDRWPRRRLRVPRPRVRPAGHDRAKISLPRSVRPCSVRLMPSAELITQTVNRYLELVSRRAPRTTIADLYADDATRRGSGRRRRGAHRPPGHPRFLHEHGVARARRPRPVITLRVARPRGGLPVEADRRSRRGRQDAIEIHQRHGVRRRGQDHGDEGLLGPGEHHPARNPFAISAR